MEASSTDLKGFDSPTLDRHGIALFMKVVTGKGKKDCNLVQQTGPRGWANMPITGREMPKPDTAEL
jgi:hypothetical protein